MIIGHKIGLRPVEETDLEMLARWRNHPDTRRMFFTPFLLSLDGQKQWYERLLSNPARLQFMVVRLADGKIIGTIGLDHIDYRNQEAQAGSIIIEPEGRGQSYAVDSVTTLIGYVFSELNLHRLYARAFAFNKAALKMGERAGFRVEGIARQAAFVDGEFHDVVLQAVLREEWQG